MGQSTGRVPPYSRYPTSRGDERNGTDDAGANEARNRNREDGGRRRRRRGAVRHRLGDVGRGGDEDVVVSTTKNAKFGTILVSGKTLYTLKASKTPCTATCLKIWPALVLPKGVTKATAGSGVSAGEARHGDAQRRRPPGDLRRQAALLVRRGHAAGQVTRRTSPTSGANGPVVVTSKPATSSSGSGSGSGSSAGSGGSVLLVRIRHQGSRSCRPFVVTPSALPLRHATAASGCRRASAAPGRASRVYLPACAIAAVAARPGRDRLVRPLGRRGLRRRR